MGSYAQPTDSQLYLRAWRVSIAAAQNSNLPTLDITSVGEQYPLKVTFDIIKKFGSYLWWGDVTLYNLTETTEQYIINQGDTVSVSAGYKKNFNTAANLIFKGEVFQPLWEKIDGATYALTLRCMVGMPYLMNFVSYPHGPQATQKDIVSQIAARAHNVIAIDQVDKELLSKTVLPRSKAIFGRPKDYFDQMARDNGFATYFGPKGLNLSPRKFDVSAIPDIVYAPPLISNVPQSQSTTGLTKQTLIGTPQQTQEGVSFRVEMDSDITVQTLVKLDMSAIRQLQMTPGQFPSRLDKDGLYIVTEIRHCGDTYGTEWFTEVQAMTWSFWNSFLNNKAY
jgi:hypothetical protein